VVGLTTSEFEEFASELLAQRNAQSLPLVSVAHPVGGITQEQAAARVNPGVVEQLAAALSGVRP